MHLIMPMAGNGTRVHSNIYKPYILFNGYPLFYHSAKSAISVISANNQVDSITFVIKREHLAFSADTLIRRYFPEANIVVINDSVSPVDTVLQALNVISFGENEILCINDCDHIFNAEVTNLKCPAVLTFLSNQSRFGKIKTYSDSLDVKVCGCYFLYQRDIFLADTAQNFSDLINKLNNVTFYPVKIHIDLGIQESLERLNVNTIKNGNFYDRFRIFRKKQKRSNN